MERRLVRTMLLSGAFAIAPFFGCGPGSGGTGGSASCKNPSSQQTACNACSEAHCAASLSAVSGSCSDLISCEASCDCSDSACLGMCAENSSAQVALRRRDQRTQRTRAAVWLYSVYPSWKLMTQGSCAVAGMPLKRDDDQ
jgi:hypothetical protein